LFLLVLLTQEIASKCISEYLLTTKKINLVFVGGQNKAINCKARVTQFLPQGVGGGDVLSYLLSLYLRNNKNNNNNNSRKAQMFGQVRTIA
jgi:hypothetical protein